MTSNGLDIIEIRRIKADGQREMIRLDARLQAIVAKLLAMRGEIEDKRTCQLTFHLGRKRQEGFDVEMVWQKRD